MFLSYLSVATALKVVVVDTFSTVALTDVAFSADCNKVLPEYNFRDLQSLFAVALIVMLDNTLPSSSVEFAPLTVNVTVGETYVNSSRVVFSVLTIQWGLT